MIYKILHRLGFHKWKYYKGCFNKYYQCEICGKKIVKVGCGGYQPIEIPDKGENMGILGGYNDDFDKKKTPPAKPIETQPRMIKESSDKPTETKPIPPKNMSIKEGSQKINYN